MIPPPFDPNEHPTLDDLGAADNDDAIIPAGEAQVRLSVALDAVTAAFVRLEAVSMALARQVDATARPANK